MRVTAICASLWLAACGIDAFEPLDPEIGGPLFERCANEDSDLNKSVSFSEDILPVLRAEREVGCGCHQPTKPNPIGFLETGLDLSSHAGLLAGGVNSRGGVVKPGQPCDSIIWQKISPGPPFGARMPFDGPPFLDDDTRQLIADWIAEGARDN